MTNPTEVSPWIPDEELVIVVAGRWAEPVALRYGLYICQDERSFRPARHMAFCAQGRICYLFEITEPPFNHCNPENTPLLATIEGYEFDAPSHQVMHLNSMREIGPIRNDLVSRTGRGVAYTQGQRYTTLTRILTAHTTSELVLP